MQLKVYPSACPNCGGTTQDVVTAIRIDQEDPWTQIRCGCGLATPLVSGRSAAITWWNDMAVFMVSLKKIKEMQDKAAEKEYNNASTGTA